MSALPDFLLAPVERLLNDGITQAPETRELVAALEGRSMSVCVQPPGWIARIGVVGGRLGIRSDTQSADVRVSGSPLELNRLFFIDERAPLREGHVSITGDAEVAEQFRELLRQVSPDPEQQLARIFGEPAAFQFSNAMQSFTHWARTAGETTADHVSDILQEDSDLLPTPGEIAQFNAGVDDARNTLARLEARFKYLRRALAAADSGSP